MLILVLQELLLLPRRFFLLRLHLLGSMGTVLLLLPSDVIVCTLFFKLFKESLRGPTATLDEAGSGITG